MRRTLGVLVLCVALVSCATIAPIEVRFQEVAYVTSVDSVPGDEELVEVPVGALKQAVFIGEAYEALLVLHNLDVGNANKIIEAYNELGKEVTKAKIETVLYTIGVSGAILLGVFLAR